MIIYNIEEYSEKLFKENLEFVDPHWWCKNKITGIVVDPTAKQFPSKGLGTYTPFNGMIECVECGKSLLEEDAKFYGRYSFCSDRCIIVIKST
jgi:hypothetical protein